MTKISGYQPEKRAVGNPFVIREGKYRFRNLKDSFYHLDWAEDSFLSGDSDKEMLTRTFDLGKIRYIIGFIVMAVLVLILRVGWLQIVKGDYYYGMAEGNRLKVKSIEPRRGIIYDRDFKQLVRNDANFLLYLTPIDLPKSEMERDQVLRHLSSILDGASTSSSKTAGAIEMVADSPSFYEMKSKLDAISYGSLDSYQPLFVADNIEYDKALQLYLAADAMPGVIVSNKIRREYLSVSTSTGATPGSLSHILGYTGKISEADIKRLGVGYTPLDYVGKSGLEYFWENELKGKSGQKHIEVDALGKEKKIINSVPPKDGDNLQLSIDAPFQLKIEEILKEHLRSLKLHRASVIAMKPDTGEIIALVSWPAYDNNVFAKGISQADYKSFLDNPDRPLFNRAISGEFACGSTIKPVFSAAALAEGVITEFTTVLSTGGLHLGQWVFPDWKAGGHGIVDVKKAIAESVNTFYYYIGGGFDKFEGLGIERLMKYAKLFGLGQQSGIDLPSESSGFVPSPEWKEEAKGERWYIGDTYHFAIGQGDVNTTPLQVANFTAVFANGGKLMRPHVVKRIVDGSRQTVTEIQPEIVRENMVSDKVIDIVRRGMRQTVLNGSARLLQSLPVSAAGKTGTAQWSSKKDPHAWFTGFAPYEDPKLVLTVLVEEGKEGSSAATPIARDILNYYFSASSTPAITASSSAPKL
jgi:penicillin-binding protein 2